MGIDELMKKVKLRAKKRTHEDRIELLKKAHIIGDDGYYLSEYFSEETVRKDRLSLKQKVH